MQMAGILCEPTSMDSLKTHLGHGRKLCYIQDELVFGYYIISNRDDYFQYLLKKFTEKSTYL